VIPDLSRVLDSLEAAYGRPEPPPAHGPLEWILWENVAYLVDDRRRRDAFEALRQRVGVTPDAILKAAPATLREIAEQGGIFADQRVGKLLQIAEIAKRRFGGDLNAVLRQPLTAAKKALRVFPGIGVPGTEKILLFCGRQPVFALESNGLRVLLRLGFGVEKKSYDATYRAVQAAAEPQIRKDCSWLIRAHLLLRRHGQELCRRSHPLCPACPVAGECAYARRSGMG